MDVARLLEELAIAIAKLRFIEAELQKAQRSQSSLGSQPPKPLALTQSFWRRLA